MIQCRNCKSKLMRTGYQVILLADADRNWNNRIKFVKLDGASIVFGGLRLLANADAYSRSVVHNKY